MQIFGGGLVLLQYVQSMAEKQMFNTAAAEASGAFPALAETVVDPQDSKWPTSTAASGLRAR